MRDIKVDAQRSMRSVACRPFMTFSNIADRAASSCPSEIGGKSSDVRLRVRSLLTQDICREEVRPTDFLLLHGPTLPALEFWAYIEPDTARVHEPCLAAEESVRCCCKRWLRKFCITWLADRKTRPPCIRPES